MLARKISGLCVKILYWILVKKLEFGLWNSRLVIDRKASCFYLWLTYWLNSCFTHENLTWKFIGCTDKINTERKAMVWLVKLLIRWWSKSSTLSSDENEMNIHLVSLLINWLTTSEPCRRDSKSSLAPSKLVPLSESFYKMPLRDMDQNGWPLYMSIKNRKLEF